jgi:hypothetical protein
MGRVTWLAHAADAGPDGNRKLDQAWRVGMEAEGSGETGVTLPLDRAALSVALGRDNVVHLALTDRASAERLAPGLARLNHYLGLARLLPGRTHRTNRLLAPRRWPKRMRLKGCLTIMSDNNNKPTLGRKPLGLKRRWKRAKSSRPSAMAAPTRWWSK